MRKLIASVAALALLGMSGAAVAGNGADGRGVGTNEIPGLVPAAPGNSANAKSDGDTNCVGDIMKQINNRDHLLNTGQDRVAGLSGIMTLGNLTQYPFFPLQDCSELEVTPPPPAP